MMSYFTGVLLFALGIAFTIALHEWGHFTAARYYGMKVRRFFVGFGPEVFSFQRGETVYGLKAIPLGGFCDIVGMTNQDEVDPEDEPRAMRNKPWWQRIIVLLGGIIMNLLIALIILYGLAVTSGLPNQNPDTTAVVGEVGCVAPRQLDAKNLAPCTGSGPAAAGGVKAGDRIVGVDSTSLESFEQLREYVKTRPNQTITLHVERGDQKLDRAGTYRGRHRRDQQTAGALCLLRAGRGHWGHRRVCRFPGDGNPGRLGVVPGETSRRCRINLRRRAGGRRPDQRGGRLPRWWGIGGALRLAHVLPAAGQLELLLGVLQPGAAAAVGRWAYRCCALRARA